MYLASQPADGQEQFQQHVHAAGLPLQFHLVCCPARRLFGSALDSVHATPAQVPAGYANARVGASRNMNPSTMPATNPPICANVATPPVSCVPSWPTPLKNCSTIHSPSTTNAGRRTKKMKIRNTAVSTGAVG